jgi:iron-sulfur cluster assembly accessory protein
MNFTITPKAEKFMRLMVMSDGGPGAGFRLAVSPGGCSGLNADICVLREPRPGDAVVQKGAVKLFLPAESRILLDGVTVDFTDTAAKTGLVFHDPKATTCASHGQALPAGL